MFKAVYFSRRMGKTFDSSAMIPAIRIERDALIQIKTIAQQLAHGASAVALMEGIPDYSGPEPSITFNNFRQMENPEVIAENDEAVPVWVLFQSESIPISADFIEEYVTANKDPHEYRTTYYYRIICCAYYSTRLELKFITIAPNVSVTLMKVRDLAKSARHTKLRSYADFESLSLSSGFVDATFQGLHGIDDPRILALGYCIGLAYPSLPVRAVIQKGLYELSVVIQPNFFRYEGVAVIKNGAAKVQLKVEGGPLAASGLPYECPPQPQDEDKPGDMCDIIAKIEDMGKQLAILQSKIREQDVSYREALEARDRKTTEMFQTIIQHLAKTSRENAIPRLAPPRQVLNMMAQAEKRPCSIEVSLDWERPLIQTVTSRSVTESPKKVNISAKKALERDSSASTAVNRRGTAREQVNAANWMMGNGTESPVKKQYSGKGYLGSRGTSKHQRRSKMNSDLLDQSIVCTELSVGEQQLVAFLETVEG
jgi:hypothetical protein